MNTIKVTATVSRPGSVSATVSRPGSVSANIKSQTDKYPLYDGTSEVTPTSFEQVLSTKDTIIKSNIVIKPIPSNYGLITYNGSVITVS